MSFFSRPSTPDCRVRDPLGVPCDGAKPNQAAVVVHGPARPGLGRDQLPGVAMPFVGEGDGTALFFFENQAHPHPRRGNAATCLSAAVTSG